MDLSSVSALISATQSRSFGGTYGPRDNFFRAPLNPRVCDAASVPPAMSGEPADRFDTDFAAEDKQRRRDAKIRKDAEFARRRFEGVARDAARLAGAEAAERAAEELAAARRADGSKARRNQSGVAFNPLTLSLHDSPDGAAFAATEAAARARKATRAATLDARSRSSAFDIVTGIRKPTG